MRSRYVIWALGALLVIVSLLYMFEISSAPRQTVIIDSTIPIDPVEPYNASRVNKKQILASFAQMEQAVTTAGVNAKLKAQFEKNEAYMTPIKPYELFPEQEDDIEREKSKYAIVSGCFSDRKDYLRASMMLGYSLKHIAKTRLQTVMLITKECTPLVPLLKTFWDVIVPITTKFVHYNRDLGFLFQKLKSFLLPYERVIWMGSDILVLKNLDHLVHCTVPCAAKDMALVMLRRLAPQNGKTNNVGYSYYPHPTINGDFLVFEPSRATYDRLVAFINSTTLFGPGNYGGLEHYYGPYDQAVLNEVIPHWTILDFNYSLEVCLSDSIVWQQFWDCCADSLSTLHFATSMKPWTPVPDPKGVKKLPPAMFWKSKQQELIKALPGLLKGATTEALDMAKEVYQI